MVGWVVGEVEHFIDHADVGGMEVLFVGLLVVELSIHQLVVDVLRLHLIHEGVRISEEEASPVPVALLHPIVVESIFEK